MFQSSTSDMSEEDFPFYTLDTGKRKYQQRRLKPQTESLEKEAAARCGKIERPIGRRKKKFVGVRQRSSGRWVAEIKDTTQKIRLWLGTFDTAEDAARAYDEAACMLRGMNTRTNFMPSIGPNGSGLPSKAAKLLVQRLGSISSSSSTTQSKLSSKVERQASNPPKHAKYLQPTEHDFAKAEPLHVQSFTNLLQEDHIQRLEDDSLFHELDQQNSFSSYTDYSHHPFPDTVCQLKSSQSHSLSDAISGLDDLTESVDTTSLFDFANDFTPSCTFDELSVLEGLSEHGITEFLDVNDETREQILRMKFDRISSGSLFAMNGVQEILSDSLHAGTSYLLSSPSFGRPKNLRSPLPCKMFDSPSWLPRQGSSPAAHKSNEYSQDNVWGGSHLCGVA